MSLEPAVCLRNTVVDPTFKVSTFFVWMTVDKVCFYDVVHIPFHMT